MASKRATIARFYMTTRGSLTDRASPSGQSPLCAVDVRACHRPPLATEFLVATLLRVGFDLTQSQQTRWHFSRSNKLDVSENGGGLGSPNDWPAAPYRNRHLGTIKKCRNPLKIKRVQFWNRLSNGHSQRGQRAPTRLQGLNPQKEVTTLRRG